jgi:Transposase
MLFVGDDWAEDHHDVYLMNETGERLASRRMPEGLAGMRGLHQLIVEHAEDLPRWRSASKPTGACGWTL